MLKNLVELLKNMSSLSISGDVKNDEGIKVFCNVAVVEDAENIKISGLNDQLEDDCFIINFSNVIDISIENELEDYFKDVYLYLKDGSEVLIESF